MNYINKLILNGFSVQTDPQVQRRIVFSNVTYISLALVYFIFIIIDIPSYLKSPFDWNMDDITVPAMIGCCLLALYLNTRGHSFTGRVFFILSWPILMHILPVIILHTPSDYYLAFPLGIILHAVMIQLFFSFKKERWIYIGLLAVNFAGMLSVRWFLIINDQNSQRLIEEGIVNNSYYSLIVILYWLIFNFLIFYILRVVEGYIEENHLQQEILTNNNERLVHLVEQFEKSNHLLMERLDKQSVEINDVLTEYSNFNAHFVRGPYCRLKGILHLRELNAISLNEYQLNMNKSMEELDIAMQKMQTQIEEKIDLLSKRKLKGD